MSKKTIYKYFDSKEQIVHQAAWDFINEYFSELKPIIESDDNAIQKMNRVLGILSRISMQLSDKWIYDVQLHFPELWKEIDDFRTNNIFVNISKIFEHGKKEGVYRDIPVEILIAAFTSSLRTIVSPDFFIKSSISFRDAVLTTFDLFFNGVTTEKGRKLTKHIKPEIQ
jgi:hypothetical protein